MLISTAFAQDAAAQTGSALDMFIPMLLVLAVFYFLLFRPQQKKQKEHQAMQAGIRRGDKIVTAGGIMGTVSKVVDDAILQVEIAEGVKVRVQKASVSALVSKTEPVKADAKDDSSNDDAPDDDAEGGSKSGSKGLKNLLKK